MAQTCASVYAYIENHAHTGGCTLGGKGIERQDMAEQYLNTLLPENRDGMDLHERRNCLSDRKDPSLLKGTVLRQQERNVNREPKRKPPGSLSGG